MLATGNPASYGYGDLVHAAWLHPQFVTFNQVGDELELMAGHPPTDEELASGLNSNIAYAEVSCDGGPPLRKTRARPDPATGRDVYAFPLGPSFQDGGHGCRAVIVPTTGVPKILQGDKVSGDGSVTKELFFTTNFHGGLPFAMRWVAVGGNDTSTCGLIEAAPCATISYAKDRIFVDLGSSDIGGGKVCLKEGGYQFGKATENFGRTAGWQPFTVEGCGVDRESVWIEKGDGGGSIRVSKLKLKNLQMRGLPIGSGSFSPNPPAMCWADQVDFIGPGPNVRNSSPMLECLGGFWVTNSSFSNMGVGRAGDFGRNLEIFHIAGDAYSDARVGLNIHVWDQVGHHTGATGDSVTGSTVITNVSNFDLIQVGTMTDYCGVPPSQAGGAASSYVVSVDHAARTLTLNDACTITASGISLSTGIHPDVVQWRQSHAGGIYLSNLVATDRIRAEGIFTEVKFGGQDVELSNLAIENVAINNQTQPSDLTALLFRAKISNAWLSNLNITGPAGPAAGFLPSNFTFDRSVCSDPFGPAEGVNFRQSDTCR